MKKMYEIPSMDILHFSAMDVIRTSNPDDYELPIDPASASVDI